MREYVPRVPHEFRRDDYPGVFLVPAPFWLHLRKDCGGDLRGYILGMN